MAEEVPPPAEMAAAVASLKRQTTRIMGLTKLLSTKVKDTQEALTNIASQTELTAEETPSRTVLTTINNNTAKLSPMYSSLRTLVSSLESFNDRLEELI